MNEIFNAVELMGCRNSIYTFEEKIYIFQKKIRSCDLYSTVCKHFNCFKVFGFKLSICLNILECVNV